MIKHSPLTLVLTSLIATSVQAQIAGLEEIIVTAQKREESLQAAPISIAAFGSEALEKMGITSVMDIDKSVPNVVLNPFPASRTAVTAFIRSIGNVDLQVTKDAAVGIYMDGVFLGRASGLATDIADLERIEVLRGPQGTLYGRNTTGGAINMITAKPGEELAFRQKVSVGNRDWWLSQTTLNVPITDTLSARVSYLRSDRDGWVRNRGVGKDFSEDRKEAGRVALRWQVNDDFTIDYAWDRSEHEGGMSAYQITDALTPAFARYASSSRRDTLSSGTNNPGGIDDAVSGHALTLTWEINDSTELKSISAYRDLRSRNYYDYSLSVNHANRFGGIIQPLRSFMPRGAEILDAYAKQNQWQLSQEFQIVGDAFDNRLQYAVGLYFYKEQGWDRQEPQNNVLALNALNLGQHHPGYPLMLAAMWVGYHVQAKSESQAIYGQFTYTPEFLEDRLHLTLGLRYTEDERSARKAAAAYDPGLFDPSLQGTVVLSWNQYGSTDSTNFSPSFTVAYDVTDRVNVYAKYSEAYRAGGFNARSDQSSFGRGFDPEKLTAHEAGIKSDWLSNRLRVNGAVFHYSYDDMQVDQNIPPNIGVTRTLNAGKAQVDGVEIDITALLMDDLTLTLNYGYLDAEFKEFFDTQTCDGSEIIGGGTVEVSSCRSMPAAPRNTYSVALDYAFPWVNVGELSAHVQYHRQDASAFAVRGGWAGRGAFDLVSASLTWAGIPVGGGEFRAMLWGRNLGDEKYFAHAMSFGAFQLATFGEPRSWGLDLIYEF